MEELGKLLTGAKCMEWMGMGYNGIFHSYHGSFPHCIPLLIIINGMIAFSFWDTLIISPLMIIFPSVPTLSSRLWRPGPGLGLHLPLTVEAVSELVRLGAQNPHWERWQREQRG